MRLIKVISSTLVLIFLLSLFPLNNVSAENKKGPSITAENITKTSITLKVIYPVSGIYGDRLELYNYSNGTWTDITKTYYTKDGSYVCSNLTSGTSYMGRLTYLENNNWKVADLSIMTLAGPEVLTKREGLHVFMNLESEDTSVIQDTNYSRWIAHLDAAYEAYYDLVGEKPYSGQKIEIRSQRAYPGGWAVAGNPILWHEPYVKEQLIKCNDHDDWSFGILHEIGHDYDSGSWNFNGEFWANTKMYYIVETLNATVHVGGSKFYTGTELLTYYKTDANYSYDNTIANGSYHHDALTYCFIRLKDIIGWEPFKKTFRYFNTLPSNNTPKESIEKFNLFMSKLRDFSGQDTLATFTDTEKSIIGEALGGNIAYVREQAELPPVKGPSIPVKTTAKPTSSVVFVNGEKVLFQAYVINGNNYFKLRDLAYALNSTKKPFEVVWNGDLNAISLERGSSYTVVGGELEINKDGQIKTAKPSSAKVYVDLKEAELTSFVIDGNNYYKLRDIAAIIDFGVSWDGASNTINMNTSVGYTP